MRRSAHAGTCRIRGSGAPRTSSARFGRTACRCLTSGDT